MKYETPEMEIIFIDRIDDIVTVSNDAPINLFNAEGGEISFGD